MSKVVLDVSMSLDGFISGTSPAATVAAARRSPSPMWSGTCRLRS